MDWIAYRLLLDTLGSTGNTVVADFPPSEVRDAAMRLHLARADYHHSTPSKHALERALGREVADRLLYLFERLPESSSNAWELFVRLSFDLNLLPHFPL